MHHAVAFGGGVEERGTDELGAAVGQLLQRHGLNQHVGRHAVPLETRNDPLDRRDFSITALEAMHAMIAVLDEAPMATAFELEALDDQAVAASPPLRDEFGLGHRLPHPLALGVEDALHAKFAITRRAEQSARRGADCLVHHSFPFVRSRNASRWSKRSASICW